MDYIVGPSWDRRVITIEPKGKIGIAMSGGIDSWVVYNTLPKNVMIFNIKRKDGADSSDNIRRLINRDDIIEIDEDTTEHATRIRRGITNILDRYDIDQLYTGVNHIPPLAHFPEFSENKPNRPWINPYKRLKTPLLHTYKYHIIDLAKQLNIDLSNTHSCLVQNFGHCGKCWQCRERQWGFDQLKQQDQTIT